MVEPMSGETTITFFVLFIKYPETFNPGVSGISVVFTSKKVPHTKGNTKIKLHRIAVAQQIITSKVLGLFFSCKLISDISSTP